MKKPTITLVILASAAYYAILFLARSFLPPNVSTPLYLIALPLVVLVLIVVSDLSYRSTTPSQPRKTKPKVGKTILEVQDIRKKIEVAATASPEYFDNVLRAQLREILVEKMSLKMGLATQTIRETLANQKLGPGLLRNNALYNILYGPTPAKGQDRIKTVEDAVELLEEWKP